MIDARKKWLVILMFLSCLLSGFILFVAEPPESNTIRSLAELDQVINTQFEYFRSEHDRMRTHNTIVDSLFTRKNFILQVKPDFPSTAFHAAIAEQLQPKGIEIHGQRTFPERKLHLKLLLSGKLVRTIDISIVRD